MKVIEYILLDLTMGTQEHMRGQKELLSYLRGIGYKVNNNELARINKEEDGELNIESVYGHKICIQVCVQ
jgi:hypothetical protein